MYPTVFHGTALKIHGFRPARESQADELAQLTQGNRLGDVPRVDVLQELS